MPDRVLLVGLDFGTTTSCAQVASARLSCNARTGQMELSDIRPERQPEPVFTPFAGERLDETRLGEYLAEWLADIDPAHVFGGGALVTGLAAERSNAGSVARQTRRFLKNAVVAVANDPRLESWLAFMGNCAELSLANPGRTILNLDIGGGTTNIALGQAGEVSRTGSYYVGARHVMVEPGGYRITGLTSQARELCDHLQIRKDVGDELESRQVLAIVDWYLSLLQTMITDPHHALDPVAAVHQQSPFALPPETADAAVTLSGGVGALVYQHRSGHPWPATTAFGDLGIDIAQRIVETPFWQQRMGTLVPSAQGRATVYGLLRYSTQVSGSTVYLPDPQVLPLADLLIVGTLNPDSSPDEIERLLQLAATTSSGACLRIEWPSPVTPVRDFATRLGIAIARHDAFLHQPLVLLMRNNLGKVFGQYATRWGASRARVMVVDEVDHYDAQFAQIGGLQGGVVPVSFYGMGPSVERP